MSCRYKAKVQLPDIKKKILYLDQFFFSHAFREGDERFKKAAQLVGRVSNLQLLVAPFSSLHEDETYQWRGYDGKNKQELINFIKTTSRGHEFLPAYEVQRRQIVRAFQAFLESNSDVFVSEEHDALKNDIHQWHDYFRIDIDRYLGNSELKREMKSRSVEELFRAFPEWKKSTNSFDQDVALEVQESYKNYLITYFRDNFKAARDFDPAMFDSSFTSAVVGSLVRCLPEDIPLENKWDRILQFFKSSFFRNHRINGFQQEFLQH